MEFNELIGFTQIGCSLEGPRRPECVTVVMSLSFEFPAPEVVVVVLRELRHVEHVASSRRRVC